MSKLTLSMERGALCSITRNDVMCAKLFIDLSGREDMSLNLSHITTWNVNYKHTQNNTLVYIYIYPPTQTELCAPVSTENAGCWAWVETFSRDWGQSVFSTSGYLVSLIQAHFSQHVIDKFCALCETLNNRNIFCSNLLL